MRCREIQEQLLIPHRDWCRVAGVGCAEVSGQIYEVGDGHRIVVVDVAFLPGDIRAGCTEVAGEVDEIADGHRAVEI